MPSPGTLGDRMKRYEEVCRTTLTPRMPVILRLDGRGFSTYTKGLWDRPFNPFMLRLMEETAVAVCNEIQGAQFAYVQSDEISILVHGYQTHETQPWFDNQIQKMVSVTAAKASVYFSLNSWRLWQPVMSDDRSDVRPVTFDCRAFVVPEDEVCNYFIWRQQDCIRNSILGHARTLFSHNECVGKNGSALRKMCADRGEPWEERWQSMRQGRALEKTLKETTPGVFRAQWTVNETTPLFQKERLYVEKHLQRSEKPTEL